MSLPFDQVCCVDYETFYSDDYGLGKLAQTEYIRDQRFEAQSAAIKVIGTEARAEVCVGYDAIYKGLRKIDWSRTAFLAHHTNFDGLITTHHFGVYPAFWLDTMGMARFVFGIDEPATLKHTCERMGRPGKVHGAALVDVKGKRLADFTPDMLANLCEYNADDVEDTIWAYERLVKLMPENELKLIDITVRMYAEPTMLLDGKRLEALYKSELERKKGILERLAEPLAYTLRKQLEDQDAKYAAYEAKGKTYAQPKLTRNQFLMKEMGSAPKFAMHLQAAGIEPPTKISGRTGKEAFAFAKGDLDFKVLLDHPTEHVRDLVEARLMSKSSIVETRSEKLLGRVDYPTPIYLNYCAARTQRWGGGDAVNWQNPPRRGPGAEIRKALVAPPGTMMIIADASQIEARMNAWLNGQVDKLDVFRKYDRKEGPDVYCFAATAIYNRLIDAILNPDERFVGKVFELAAGYGAGARKVNYMFRAGQFGPPMQQDLDVTERNLHAWRRTNNKIVAGWNTLDATAKLAFLGDRQISYGPSNGPLIFEGHKRGGYLHGPHGGYMFYPNIHQNEEGGISYVGRNGTIRMWGGIWDENCLSYGTLVLTARGWIEIQNVRASDLVHDGESFVAHSGVVAKGEQPCTVIDGVYMTPDHEVLTDNGWQAASQAPRPHRPDFRPANRTARRVRTETQDVVVVPMSMWESVCQERLGSYQADKARADAALRVSKTAKHGEADTQHVKTPGVCGVVVDESTMQSFNTSRVGKLRRAWNYGMRALGSVRRVLGGHGTYVSTRSITGSYEQQFGILAGELSLGKSPRAGAQYAGIGDSRSASVEQGIGSRAVDAVLPLQTRPVFDILNAGPKTRFVVLGNEGPFVVHNCCQFLSRVLLGEQMVIMAEEFPEMRIVMSTHDEVGIIIEKAKAERVAHRVKEIMSTPSFWCEDIPLNADVKAASFYNKS